MDMEHDVKDEVMMHGDHDLCMQQCQYATVQDKRRTKLN